MCSFIFLNKNHNLDVLLFNNNINSNPQGKLNFSFFFKSFNSLFKFIVVE